MGKTIVVLFLLNLLAVKMSECGPVVHERTFWSENPLCNFSTPCLDPLTFCGSNVEIISRWFGGYRCYPKKSSMGLCNQSVVCLSGVCNILAFGIGLCL
ncbi:hypothetical protein GHT06_020883 [Daphnia sinensis]|uniref:Single domain-containing protein n=1 Tax=Daphnia sinensis TaxID=1820382 RepID=A0AAD5KID5_9CRUS|nr:hypothetical protein GHT06_020883 [Daphnia sinensis]